MMKMRKLSFAIALFLIGQVSAQKFTLEAEVEAVEQAAYHKILLSPELLGSTEYDQSDIRLYDQEGKEQPYLITEEEAESVTAVFTAYEITDQKYKEDTISHITFHNPEKEAIDNVSFVVRNTDVQKRARLSGSDDGVSWFIIKDNYLLHGMHSDEETTELKILDFPLSDYEYFRLDINDNWRLPINILKVGYYDTQKTVGKVTTFDCPIEYQKDSAKKTYLKIAFDTPRYFEKLKIEVSGADYYSRYTDILVKKETVDRKNRVSTYFHKIGSFELNSNSTNEVDLRRGALKEFYIQIDNRDNAPLKVEQITGSFLNKYAVAELNPLNKYVLKWGDKTIHSPEYDIAVFADRIPEDALKINHSKIKSLIEKVEEVKEKGVFENPYIIWSIIGAVGLLLGFVSLRMVKEIGQK